jgi:hypothetical protein
MSEFTDTMNTIVGNRERAVFNAGVLAAREPGTPCPYAEGTEDYQIWSMGFRQKGLDVKKTLKAPLQKISDSVSSCQESKKEPKAMLADTPPPVPLTSMQIKIKAKCQELSEFLVEKNRAYGNSASDPLKVFAKRLDTLAQIDARIDDKLNRLAKGSEYPGDDTVKDLAGYLVLRMVVAESNE